MYEKQYHLEKAVNLTKWKKKKENENRKEIKQDTSKNCNDITGKKSNNEKTIATESTSDPTKLNKKDINLRNQIITGKIPGNHNDRKRKLLKHIPTVIKITVLY